MNYKYSNQKSGHYDSRKEHRRAALLQMLQRCGEITDLQEQVKFTLIPSQRDDNGKLIERECSYVADFTYTDKDGNHVVEDTKGFRTKEYIIKRKLMLYIHKIKINEI